MIDRDILKNFKVNNIPYTVEKKKVPTVAGYSTTVTKGIITKDKVMLLLEKVKLNGGVRKDGADNSKRQGDLIRRIELYIKMRY